MTTLVSSVSPLSSRLIHFYPCLFISDPKQFSRPGRLQTNIWLAFEHFWGLIREDILVGGDHVPSQLGGQFGQQTDLRGETNHVQFVGARDRRKFHNNNVPGTLSHLFRTLVSYSVLKLGLISGSKPYQERK